MEKAASLQRANQQHRLVEWSRRVEACRSSGLPAGQWCRENGIAVSTYFSWQRKVFQALKEVQEVTFAEVPVRERSQPLGHIAAAMEVSGVRIQVYAGADEAPHRRFTIWPEKIAPRKKMSGERRSESCCSFPDGNSTLILVCTQL